MRYFRPIVYFLVPRLCFNRIIVVCYKPVLWWNCHGKKECVNTQHYANFIEHLYKHPEISITFPWNNSCRTTIYSKLRFLPCQVYILGRRGSKFCGYHYYIFHFLSIFYFHTHSCTCTEIHTLAFGRAIPCYVLAVVYFVFIFWLPCFK